MGRPPNQDRSTVAGLLVTLRLTPMERGLLDKLVEMRRGELDEATVSASSLLRGLIRREAIAKGLLEAKTKTKGKREPRAR
jgi:hypothetical protein